MNTGGKQDCQNDVLNHYGMLDDDIHLRDLRDARFKGLKRFKIYVILEFIMPQNQ